jgi:LemA protein
MTIILLALVIFGIIYTVILYNSLVSKRNIVENAWAQIDVLLKRRHDLIENLVETVKGYAAHERTTLENVTKARTQAITATTTDDKIKAEGILTGALKSLFAVVENYPNLKANENFIALQNELANTENQIASARQNYNNTVLAYNIALQAFPSNIVAGIFGFKKEREYLEIEEERKEEKEPVKVKF